MRCPYCLTPMSESDKAHVLACRIEKERQAKALLSPDPKGTK
jgi:hypothetical protein